MSASPIEYHTANQVVPEQVPIDLAPCSKCGSELAIFKVEQVSDFELILHWRCDHCYYPVPTLIRLVFVPVIGAVDTLGALSNAKLHYIWKREETIKGCRTVEPNAR